MNPYQPPGLRPGRRTTWRRWPGGTPGACRRNHPWMTGGSAWRWLAVAAAGGGIRRRAPAVASPCGWPCSAWRLRCDGGSGRWRASRCVGCPSGPRTACWACGGDDAGGELLSLILPGLAAAKEMTGSGVLGGAHGGRRDGAGGALMLGLDRFFTPHEHESSGPCGPGCERIGRVWLFVLAITPHNLPEGHGDRGEFRPGDMGTWLAPHQRHRDPGHPRGAGGGDGPRAAGSAWPAVLMAGPPA